MIRRQVPTAATGHSEEAKAADVYALAVIIIASTIFIATCWWLLPALIHETAELIQFGGRIVRGFLA